MKKYDIIQYLMMVLTGFMISSTSPAESELDFNRSRPKSGTYIVEGYVTRGASRRLPTLSIYGSKIITIVNNKHISQGYGKYISQ